MRKLNFIACALSVLMGIGAYGQDSGAGGDTAVAQPALAGKTYFLVVGGICKSEVEKKSQDGIVRRFIDTLIADFKYAPAQVWTVGVAGASGRGTLTPPTAENLKKAIAKAAADISPEDRFVFYYKGQANVLSDTARINLAGPDITHDEFAQMMKSVKAAVQIIILDCPGAGLMVEYLTGEGRIILCGARGDQPYTTFFSEYFVPALTDKQADLDKNGAISLFEAYRLAVTRIEEYYASKDLLQSENALLEDDGDGVPTHKPWDNTEEGFDGRVAAQTYLGSGPVER